MSIEDVVDVWVLADMYHLEGLKFCCLPSLERNLWEENEVPRILKEAKDLSCPCDDVF